MKTTTLKTMTKTEARSFLEDREAWRLYAAGVALLRKDRVAEAVVALEQALEREPEDHHTRSYLGLALCLEGRKGHEPLDLCEAAAKADPYDAELLNNLARVYIASNKRRKAYGVLNRARRLDDRHTGVKNAIQTLGVRRPPVLRFLPRRHPLNVTLGKMFSSMGLR